MKKNIKYNILGLLLLLFAFASCDTADQTPAEVISPDYKPTVTVTSDRTGSVNEGAVITYTITFDKIIDRAVTFSPTITGGTANEEDYVAIDPVTIEPYTKSVQFQVTTNTDAENEPTETLMIQLGIEAPAQSFLIHPDTVLAPINISIKDAGILKIKFQWTTFVTKDFDMVTWDATSTPLKELGDGGATTANPEYDSSIMLIDPVGNYYVSIMDWGEGVAFNYTFTITHPDNSVQTITGTFNGAAVSTYTNDQWTAWGGSYDSYRVLKVVNDGTKFVITKL